MGFTELIDPTPLQTLKKHSGPVLNVVFTKTGTHCISTSQDKSLVLWNPQKGLPIKQYKGPHNYETSDVSITSDNAKFISVGGDKSAFLWDVATGNVIHKFSGHHGKINVCSLSPNDTVLWTGGYDKLVRLFDLRVRSKPILTIDDAKDSISSFMPLKGPSMLVTSIDGTARCYDIRRGQCTIDKFPAPLLRGGLTHDDRCYVINALDECVRLVETETGNVLNTFRGHKSSNYMLNAQLTPDDSYVVGSSEDGNVYIWDVCAKSIDQSTSPQKTFYQVLDASCGSQKNETAKRDCVFTVKFHPEEWIMLTCHNNGVIRVWKKFVISL